ncbi:hypothetical protein [Halorubrum californiense]|nr:hypothetical protein [Halorubrum californiense]
MNRTDENTLQDVIEQLDEEEASALRSLIDESPELLRQILDEYGYLEEVRATDDGRFISNAESVTLTEAQTELSHHLDSVLKESMTLSEILDEVGSESAEFREQYSSAQYRSWLGDQLAALVSTGHIGRFKKGRTVHYTSTPEEAVRHWGRLNERFPEDISIADVRTISSDTGMPNNVVRDAIRQVSNE